MGRIIIHITPGSATTGMGMVTAMAMDSMTTTIIQGMDLQFGLVLADSTTPGFMPVILVTGDIMDRIMMDTGAILTTPTYGFITIITDQINTAEAQIFIIKAPVAVV
jgi:hypothetical protein